MMLARSNQGAGHVETNRARGVGVVGVGSRDADDVERSATAQAREVTRAAVLLRYAAGLSISQIQREVGVSRPTIYKCVDKALAAGGRTGLRDRYHRPREPEILPDAKAWVVSVAAPRAVHGGVLPGHRALPERNHPGADGGTPRRAAGGHGPPPRNGGAPVRFDHAANGARGVPDAAARERARRVQPDRPGLQPAPRHQPRRGSGADCRRRTIVRWIGSPFPDESRTFPRAHSRSDPSSAHGRRIQISRPTSSRRAN